MNKILISWNEKYSVGSQIIDDQHKQLINLINELYGLFKSGKAKQSIGKIINKMVTYARIHFETEEKYFKKFNYEFESEHVEEHKQFLSKVAEFQEDYQHDRISLSYEIMIFLKDWLVNHIMRSDKKYQHYFDQEIEN